MYEDRPSDTAILVARSILLASEDKQLLKLLAAGEREILRQILEDGSGRTWFDFARNHASTRRLMFLAERWLLPGIIAHYLARKRKIETAVRESIASGLEQVVIVAAGFDTLAWRLQREFPHVHMLELDHPATQQVKRLALGESPNFNYGAVDLATQSLAMAIRACPSFSMKRPAVFVIEGLTMYLTAERVAALTKDVAELAGSTGRIVFTFMEQDDDGSIGFRGENPLIPRWLAARREPFLWGITRTDLPSFLAENGLQELQVIDHTLPMGAILAELDAKGSPQH